MREESARKTPNTPKALGEQNKKCSADFVCSSNSASHEQESRRVKKKKGVARKRERAREREKEKESGERQRQQRERHPQATCRARRRRGFEWRMTKQKKKNSRTSERQARALPFLPPLELLRKHVKNQMINSRCVLRYVFAPSSSSRGNPLTSASAANIYREL